MLQAGTNVQNSEFANLNNLPRSEIDARKLCSIEEPLLLFLIGRKLRMKKWGLNHRHGHGHRHHKECHYH